MSEERDRRVLSLARALLDSDPETRARELAGLQAREPDLFEEVAALLAEVDEPLEPLEADPPVPVVPSEIGGYEVLGELGRGGMGVVYAARDGETTVAVKLIARADRALSRRLAREGRILARLDHPNIVGMKEVGETDEGETFLVMELIRGTRLDDWSARVEVGLDLRLALFSEMARAVDHAHLHGVIHRDLKPSNVLIRDGAPVVLDFGIARGTRSEDTTTTGEHIPLTPEFAAPEQLLGHRITTAADIWNLGLLLFFLLTGKRPNTSHEHPSEVVRRTLQLGSWTAETGPLPRETVSDAFSRGCGAILARAFEPRPSARYARALEFAVDVEAVLEGGPPVFADLLSRSACLLCATGDGARAARLSIALARTSGIWVPFHGFEEDVAAAVAEVGVLLVLVTPLLPNPADPCWDRVDGTGSRVAPVSWGATARPTRETRLPRPLRDRHWLEVGEEPTVNELHALARAIEARPETEHVTPCCPFRGLEAFRERDAHLFHGREALVQRLVLLLEAERFLAVVGPSGCGKSSLIRAGLLPALRRRGYGIAWVLAGQARDVGLEPSEPDSESSLIVIDQFEELFTASAPNESVQGLMARIVDLIERPGGGPRVVIVLRSDFIGYLVANRELNRYLSENMIQVEPMDQHALRRAIEVPARSAGLILEEGLVDRILADVAGSSAELPLIEHALLELYHRREGRLLTLRAYLGSGGIEGALTRRAELELARLDPEQQALWRTMITHHLVQTDTAVQDTRRRVPMQVILAAGRAPASARSVIERMVRARLITLRRAPDGEDLVELAHEALIRKWPRIPGWLDEDRAAVRLHERLREETAVWLAAKRDPAYLAQGFFLERLRRAREQDHPAWSPDEDAFVLAGIEAADREQRVREATRERALRNARRLTVLTTSTALLSVIVIAVIALFYRQARAEDRRSRARLAEQYLLQSREAFEEGRVVAALHTAHEATASLPETDTRHALFTWGLIAENGFFPERVAVDLHEVTGARQCGDLLITSGIDHRFRIYDWPSMRPRLEPIEHAHLVSPPYCTDQTIVSIGGDRIKRWNLETGALEREIELEVPVTTVAEHGHGRIWVFAGKEGRATLYDLANDRLAHLSLDIGASPRSTMTRDGTRLVTAHGDNRAIAITDTRSGVRLADFALEEPVRELALWRDRWVISITASGTLYLHDVLTGRPAARPREMGPGLRSVRTAYDVCVLFGSEVALAYDPLEGRSLTQRVPSRHVPIVDARGRFLLTMTETGIMQWRLSDGSTVASYPFPHPVRMLLEGDYLLVMGPRRARLWNIADGARMARDLVSPHPIAHMIFDERRERVLGFGHSMISWKLAEASWVPHFDDFVIRSRFVGDEDRVVVWDNSGRVSLWDSRGVRLGVPDKEINSVNFDTDSRRMMAWQWPDRLLFLDLVTGRRLRPAAIDKTNANGGFSPEGAHYYTWEPGGSVSVFASPEDHLLAMIDHEGGVQGVCMLPGDRGLLTWGGDRYIRVWSLEDGRLRATHPRFPEQIREVVVNGDGHRIMVLGEQGLVAVTASVTGQPRWSHRHPRRHTGGAFRPGGREFITWSNRRMAFWSEDRDQPIAETLLPLTVLEGLFQAERATILAADDRGIVFLALPDLAVLGRIPLPGKPAQIHTNPAGDRVSVAVGNELHFYRLPDLEALAGIDTAARTRALTGMRLGPGGSVPVQDEEEGQPLPGSKSPRE